MLLIETKKKGQSWAAAVVAVFLSIFPSLSHAAIAGTQELTPSTVPFGGLTRWSLDIQSPSTNSRGVNFDAVLPFGVVVAEVPRGSSTCPSGTVSAVAGSSSISLAGLNLGANESCAIELDLAVTSGATIDSFTISSDDSSATVDSVAAIVSELAMQTSVTTNKTDPLTLGELVKVTATMMVPTSSEGGLYGTFSFSLSLPDGLVLAPIPNGSVVCSETGNAALDIYIDQVSFAPGSSSVSMQPNLFNSAFALDPGADCEISVDAEVTGLGSLDESGSQGLTVYSQFTPLSGVTGVENATSYAVSRLETSSKELYLSHSLSPATAKPGDVVVIDYVLTNTSREPQSDISFNHDLAGVVTGWAMSDSPSADSCGSGSTLTGTSSVELSAASLASGASCSFSVTTQLPADAPTGTYVSSVSPSSSGGAQGNTSQAGLIVQAGVEVALSFGSTDTAVDVIGAGKASGLVVTLSNVNEASAASSIEGRVLWPEGAQLVTLPAAGTCGASSTFGVSLDGSGTPIGVTFSGAELGAGAECTFVYELQFPNASHGVVTAVSDSTTFVLGAETLQASNSTIDVTLTAPPRVSLGSSRVSIVPGESFDLTIDVNGNPDIGRTSIGFDLDFESVIPGAAVSLLPGNNCGVVGSDLSVANVLTARDVPDDVCSVSFAIQSPTSAATGDAVFALSNFTSEFMGVEGEGVASTTVRIGSLVGNLTIAPDFALPGDTVEFTYTIENTSPTDEVTNLQFTHNLAAFMSGANGALKTDSIVNCGALGVSGTTFLLAAGGTVSPGSTCSFIYKVSIPAGAQPQDYSTVTSNLGFIQFGGVQTAPPLNDSLTILGDGFLGLQASASPQVGLQGGLVSVSFQALNGAPKAVENGTFSLDVDQYMTGATWSGLPRGGFCGDGSSAVESSAGVITFAGLEIGPETQCDFSQSFLIPSDASPGRYLLETGLIEADYVGTTTTVSGSGAVIELGVGALEGTRTIPAFAFPGESVTVSYDINNLGASRLDGITFTDNLGSVIAGATAENLPANDVCGAGSVLSYNGSLTLTAGTLGAVGDDDTCSFEVQLSVPTDAALGERAIPSTDLFSNGLKAGEVTASNFSVEPKPVLTLASTTGTTFAGQAQTMTATIDNSLSDATVSDIALSLSLPSGVLIADPAQAASTCIGGVLTADVGASALTYTSGTVAPATSCEVNVDVVAQDAGDYSLETAFSSSAGAVADETASISYQPIPFLALDVEPTSVPVDFPVVVSYLVDNSQSALAVDNVAFSHNFDTAGLTLSSDPAVTASGCGPVEITAVSGASAISVQDGEVAAGANCTISATLTAVVGGGDKTLTTSTMTSSGGVSDAASVVLNINGKPVLTPIGNKAVAEGATLTFVVEATDNDEPTDELTFSMSVGPDGPAESTFDAATQTFSWATTYGDAGTYAATFLVFDNGEGSLSDTETIEIVVTDTNRPPSLDPVADQEISEGELLTFSLSATDPDEPAQELVFSLSGNPAGMTVDPQSGDISWQTDFGDAGEYTVTAIVTDAGTPALSAEQEFTVSVASRSSVVTFPSGAIGSVSFSTESGAGTGCYLPAPVSVLAESEVVPSPPAHWRFVDGLISFVAVSCAPGETLTVTIDYGQTIDGQVVAYKTGEPYVELATTKTGTSVSYQIVDGGIGDEDGEANGEVNDPAGAVYRSSLTAPTSAPTPVPALPLIGLLSLMYAILLMARNRLRVSSTRRYTGG